MHFCYLRFVYKVEFNWGRAKGGRKEERREDRGKNKGEIEGKRRKKESVCLDQGEETLSLLLLVFKSESNERGSFCSLIYVLYIYIYNI